MATLKLYQVDAFSDRLFGGNPAAVVPLEKWLPEETMQSIANENNLAETAFFVPVDAGAGLYQIRWFTPAVEVDLCGHATLASAHVLWTHLGAKAAKLGFESRSGAIGVERDGRGDDVRLVLDFPSWPGESTAVTPELCFALGRRPSEAYKAGPFLMAVFENKRDVHELEPDFAAVSKLAKVGVIVTAPGARHDFVSRFFAPQAGINEDPATGSAHCTLGPYWAKRLNKKHVMGHQVSKRGAEMFCEHRGERVRIGGRCVDYMEGTIRVGDAKGQMAQLQMAK